MNIKCSAIHTLGIFNSYDKDLEQKLNFLDNFLNVLKLWEFRGLTLTGRILVFKSLALSKLLYASTMKVPCKFVIDQLNTFHKNFIWNNKRPKIKHSALIVDYCKGGYKDGDIENKIAALKIKWVTKLLDSNCHLSKIIPNLLFSDIGGTRALFHQNLQLSKQCLAKIKQYPKFYQELIQIWAKASEKEPSRTSGICEEVLWNNKMITSNGDSLFNKHFVSKGILTVRDITDEYGVLLSWQEARQKSSLNSSLVFHWYGLIRRMPTTWKDELLRNAPHSSGNNRNGHCIITSKIAHQRLLKPITKPQTAQNSLVSLSGLTDIN